MYTAQSCGAASSSQLQMCQRCCPQQQRRAAGGSALLKPAPQVILTDIDWLRIETETHLKLIWQRMAAIQGHLE